MAEDPRNSAADHEARNESLIDIDEAWELCRDTIDVARISLEEALEHASSSFEARQGEAADRHREALEGSWTAYKQAITDAPSSHRRELITEARERYNSSARDIRSAFDAAMAAARDEYLSTRREAREAYDATVADAFAAHHEMVQDLGGYFDESPSDRAGRDAGRPTEAAGDTEAHSEVDLELAAVLAARGPTAEDGEQEG